MWPHGQDGKLRLTISLWPHSLTRMNKTNYMKVRVTPKEQAEWRDICRALGQDFSAIVRDTMKRRAASIKRKQEAEQ